MTNPMNISVLEDKVSDCYSIIFHIKLRDYKEIIQTACDNFGNIQGQRSQLTSQSAKKIREQMVQDFIKGSVLPPVVIGHVDYEFSTDGLDVTSLLDYLNTNKDSISLIDGMQRTAAMFEAGDRVLDREIRVELWITKSMNQLIYRMLVLNTGQVPWSMKRQLEVVLYPITTEIKAKIEDIDLIEQNDLERRSAPGQFQANRILESFLVFGARSEKVNSRDAIAEEYTRLDFIESSSKQDILEFYIEILKRIVKLDVLFSTAASTNPTEWKGKFKKGLDIFTSQPALIGITVAFAIRVLGRPNRDYDREVQKEKLNQIMHGFDDFINTLSQMQPQQLYDFINLESLSRYSPTGTSVKIGDEERAFFKNAFDVLIQDDFDIENMSVCWGH